MHLGLTGFKIGDVADRFQEQAAADGRGTVHDAKLIPQRAVTELMYKKFVYVLGDDNKVSMREVTLGPRIGRLWLVESGLEGNETVVVEGINKIKQGSEVKPEPMTEAELDTAVSLKES